MIRAEPEEPLPLTAPADARDLQTVARIAAGDERALGVLYDRWAAPLHGFALRFVREPTDAQDVVEETFWQVWRQAGRYRPERGSVGSWLCTITRTRALDRLRALQRRHRLFTDDAAAPEPVDDEATPHESAEAAERLLRVRRALDALPIEQREVLELAFFEGLSHTEIVTRTGVPLGTVKSRTRLGLQKLRRTLAPLADAVG